MAAIAVILEAALSFRLGLSLFSYSIYTVQSYSESSILIFEFNIEN